MLQDNGALEFLQARLNNSFPTSKNLTLKLFTNNIVPSSTDTAATYTEASGGGYAAITLTTGSWTVALNGSNIETATYAQQTFTFTGALSGSATVYGYYVVDSASTPAIMWAETITPFTPANNGDQILITPMFQLSHGTPAA
jgi:hypothetical protein